MGNEIRFSAGLAVWKGIRTFLKGAAAVSVAVESMILALGLPQDWATFRMGWVGYVLAIVLGLVRSIENTRKTANLPDPAPLWEWRDVPNWFWNLRRLITGACIAVVMCGCVSSRFHNEYTTSDGRVSVTDYRGNSMAWPLGKLDTTAHKLETTYGQAHVVVGQDAAGIDNTGQAAIIEAIIRAVLGASPAVTGK